MAARDFFFLWLLVLESCFVFLIRPQVIRNLFIDEGLFLETYLFMKFVPPFCSFPGSEFVSKTSVLVKPLSHDVHQAPRPPPCTGRFTWFYLQYLCCRAPICSVSCGSIQFNDELSLVMHACMRRVVWRFWCVLIAWQHCYGHGGHVVSIGLGGS